MPDSQGPFDDAANDPSVGERPYETRGRGSRSPDESLLSESVEVAPPDDSFRRLDSFGPVDSRLVEVKEAIENSLGEQVAARQNQRRSAAFFEGIGIIQGVGVGYAGATGGEFVPPGESVLTVFVADDISPERVRALLVDSLGVRAEAVEELPINVVVTGAIESMAQTSRVRPAPGGLSVSIENNAAGAGTIGCLAYGRTPPRDSRTLMLSCNHVLANSNNGAVNACVVQPGTDDGGSCPGDQVAVLERLVPINFAGATNYVDCATAWCWPERVRPELASSTVTGMGFFRLSNTPTAAVPAGSRAQVARAFRRPRRLARRRRQHDRALARHRRQPRRRPPDA